MLEKDKTKFLNSLKQSKKNKLITKLMGEGKKPLVMSKKEFKKVFGHK
jgi:hypothetical protein